MSKIKHRMTAASRKHPEPNGDDDLPTFWRVRVCMPGSILHFTSSTEPVVQMRDGRIGDVAMTLMTNVPDGGDTLGFIDWPVVTGLTWRSFKPETAE
jgi:hypothetical protein